MADATALVLGAGAVVAVAGGFKQATAVKRLKLHEAVGALLWWFARVAVCCAYAYEEGVRAYRRQREELR